MSRHCEINRLRRSWIGTPFPIGRGFRGLVRQTPFRLSERQERHVGIHLYKRSCGHSGAKITLVVGALKALYESGTDSAGTLGRWTVNGTGSMAKFS